MGIAGQPTRDIHYRIRASWQEGLGTYDKPFFDPKRNFSIGLEANYNANRIYKGITVGAAFGLDRGELLGNNTGATLTIRLEQ